MPPKDARANSGFTAFWSSLPGVLTGIAAVVAAVGTLVALFVGGEASDSQSGGAATTGPVYTGSAAAANTPGDGCLRTYFAGVTGDRAATVEAGASNLDVISESQPKAGTIGLSLTAGGRPIGAIRFAFFPANRLFKIESVVDARCRQVQDHENLAGGDRNTLQDSGTVRLRLAGGFYDFTTIAWGSAVRVNFVAVVP